MGAGILSRMRSPDDTSSIQLNRQRVVNKFLEKRRDLNCEPYFFLVILDRDLKVYDPEYEIFYRLKPAKPDEEVVYKEGDYVLFRKVDEYDWPELEEDGIEPKVFILQDIDDGTEVEAHMFFSEAVCNLLMQIYKDKIIYARTLIREMREEMNSDAEIYTDALNI